MSVEICRISRIEMRERGRKAQRGDEKGKKGKQKDGKGTRRKI